eukprot:scaffold61692_cov36-Cyclotella_meneghiniana.AAC.1
MYPKTCTTMQSSPTAGPQAMNSSCQKPKPKKGTIKTLTLNNNKNHQMPSYPPPTPQCTLVNTS